MPASPASHLSLLLRDSAAHCLPAPGGITRRHIPRACRAGRSAVLDGGPPQRRSTTIFITPAFAQAAGAAPDTTATIVQYLTLFGPILVIMYFMVLRPQQRRAKDQAELLKNIRRGDTIVTGGGIIAKVTKATEPAELEVEIAPNVRIRVARQMVTEVRAKGEPVKDAG